MRRATVALPDGREIEVGRELSRVGRGASYEVPCPETHGLSRLHFAISRRGVDFYAFDLGSTYGTWVKRDGKANRGDAAALRDRDELDLNLHARFRCEPNPDAALEAGLLAAIAAAPDDVANWSVYRDLLLTQGDPRGTRISVEAAATPIQEPLALSKNLELQWRFGHVRKLTFRGQLGALNGRSAMEVLLVSPATELLQELELHITDAPGTTPHMHGLAHLKLMPALRRVSAPRAILDQLPELKGVRLQLS